MENKVKDKKDMRNLKKKYLISIVFSSFQTILPGEILDNSEILHNSSTTTSSNEDYQFIDL